eukprot:gene1410-2708_t
MGQLINQLHMGSSHMISHIDASYDGVLSDAKSHTGVFTSIGKGCVDAQYAN